MNWGEIRDYIIDETPALLMLALTMAFIMAVRVSRRVGLLLRFVRYGKYLAAAICGALFFALGTGCTLLFTLPMIYPNKPHFWVGGFLGLVGAGQAYLTASGSSD